MWSVFLWSEGVITNDVYVRMIVQFEDNHVYEPEEYLRKCGSMQWKADECCDEASSGRPSTVTCVEFKE
jgi:hypothetical protein